MMVRLMLSSPSQWMCAEICKKELKPQIRFYQPRGVRALQLAELLQIGTATIVRIASRESGWTRDSSCALSEWGRHDCGLRSASSE
jgi:hypothetical protein